MAALMVEHLKVLISRAPKGDGGLNSRACLRILSMAALTVEHLKVMAALTVEHANAFNLLIGWGGYGRAPPDLMVEHLKVLMVEPPKGSSPLPYGRAP